MAHILDKKDKKMLYYLSKNARLSDTKLSSLIKLSKNAVKYRKERLIEQGIIKYFSVVVNPGSLKLHTFCLLLRFNDDFEEHKNIQNYFKDHLFSNWVVTLSGQWDIFAEFVIKDIDHFHKIIQGIIDHFGQKLNTYQTFFSEDILRVDHLPAEIYQDLELEHIEQKKRTIKKHNIDNTDKKILAHITKHSNQNYVEMARELNLTFEIVRYRIKLLEEQGTIIKYFPEINLRKLGFTEFLFTINLKNVSQENMASLRKHVQHNTNVKYAFFDIASFTLVFMTAFQNSKGVDHFSRKLRKDYGAIIQEQDFHIAQEQLVFNLFPKGLMD